MAIDGYANPYHLIRSFKKQFGLPPGRYRSEHRPMR
jgi:AraC-like DNA-binding protein